MSKFVVEIDSENKTFKFTEDGKEVSVDELSVGCYKSDMYNDVNYWASYSQKQDDGMVMTRYMSFSEKTEDIYEAHISYNLPKDIASLVQKTLAAMKMAKNLKKKKDKQYANEDLDLKDNLGFDDHAVTVKKDEEVKERQYHLNQYNLKK